MMSGIVILLVAFSYLAYLPVRNDRLTKEYWRLASKHKYYLDNDMFNEAMICGGKMDRLARCTYQ